MKTVKDYSKSNTPAFDAVEDIKEYFGERWPEVSSLMKGVKDKEQFAAYAGFAGIEGYPVQAWYELYFGQGSWNAKE